ncbi:MAG: prepilin-type N-terminal cleavage/methylation domain-containing protein [Clostridia bacterium]|nr:prepilin-type N-terminal cleavage/methylation domain-containing protein [Clostridia bacterium]
MKTTKKGFTLVELLVVIAILAILATVSVVGYTTFIQKANKSVDQQAVVQMNLVLKADEIVNGAPQSIDQVKDLLEANGYSDELTPIFDGYTFGWYAEANVMVLVENRTHVDFPEEYRDVDLSKIELYLHNVVTEVVDNNEAISYINTGDISGGYVQLAEGTYTGLKYGYNIGKIVSGSTGYGETAVKLNKIGSLTIGGAGAQLDGFNIFTGTATVYTDYGHYYVKQQHEIQTLKFEDVTFTDGFFMADLTGNASIKNLVFENVTFDGTKGGQSVAHIISVGNFENVTFKNCKFVNCSSVATPILFDTKVSDKSPVTSAMNITITGCTFDGASFNAMQITGTNHTYIGKIVITNNTISNTGDRGIRLAGVAGQLVITNNTLTNATDEDGQAIKYGGTPTSTELGLNTLGGKNLVWSQDSDGWVATEE